MTHEIQASMNKNAAVSVVTLIGVYGGPILTALSIAYVSFNLYFLLRDKLYRPWKAKREQPKEEGSVE
jgi:hypothetical protein